MAASYAPVGPVHKVTVFSHSNESNLREKGVASAHSSRYSPSWQGSQGRGALAQLATSAVQGCPPSWTATIFRLGLLTKDRHSCPCWLLERGAEGHHGPLPWVASHPSHSCIQVCPDWSLGKARGYRWGRIGGDYIHTVGEGPASMLNSDLLVWLQKGPPLFCREI